MPGLKRTMSIEPDVFRAAIAVMKTERSPITDPNTADAIVALLTEAKDYTTDWGNAGPSLRGPMPHHIYRKENALAAAIVVAGRLVKS